MSKRLNKLLDELGLDHGERNNMPGIPTLNITKRVNDALNAIPKEKEVYMRQKFFKSVAVTAMVVVLGVTSIFAAANFDVLKEFFVGDSSFMQQFVKTPRESVSDGQFKLTLEEMLTDKYHVLMVYSIEGLTDDAISDLMRVDPYDDFMYINTTDGSLSTMSISPHSEEHGASWYQYEIKEKRTDTTRYWAYYDELDDTSAEALRLRLNKMSGGQSITVPMNSNVETKELTLTGQPYGDVFVRLSPIGIVVEKGTKTGTGLDTAFNEVFFRMKDGGIKTYNQLASMFKGYMGVSDQFPTAENPGYHRYRYEARFLDAIPMSEFKSIIIGNIEYDINNPAKTSYVTIDEKFKPFEVEGLSIGDGSIGVCLPVEEVCDKLGADMSWDGERLTIKYRGSTVEITDHSDIYKKDGKTMPWVLISSRKTIFRTYEDKLFVEFPALAESLCIGTHEADSGGLGAMRYTTWYIIP
ncbi:MAG TPA: hypothetical protein VN441_16030 [Syntrophomonas sp.]|nr:hypothetical protein [Syntrophomonas sp.]